MCKYKFRRQFLRTAVPLLLTVSMMLTGCGQTGNSDSLVRPILPDNSPDSSTVSSGEKLPDPVTIVVEDDSTPPAEGMVRSRLTNEWVDADVAATRPIAVMIPNEASAIPQYSLSDASIIYEANVENRMTRMMAIYEDWQNLDKSAIYAVFVIIMLTGHSNGMLLSYISAVRFSSMSCWRSRILRMWTVRPAVMRLPFSVLPTATSPTMLMLPVKVCRR